MSGDQVEDWIVDSCCYGPFGFWASKEEKMKMKIKYYQILNYESFLAQDIRIGLYVSLSAMTPDW